MAQYLVHFKSGKQVELSLNLTLAQIKTELDSTTSKSIVIGNQLFVKEAAEFIELAP